MKELSVFLWTQDEGCRALHECDAVIPVLIQLLRAFQPRETACRWQRQQSLCLTAPIADC